MNVGRARLLPSHSQSHHCHRRAFAMTNSLAALFHFGLKWAGIIASELLVPRSVSRVLADAIPPRYSLLALLLFTAAIVAV